MPEKRYYWLKMEDGFFNQKEIKKLRRIAGGDTYVIIYLKMSLLSLKDDGKLYYEGVEESFMEELAYELNESIENVEITISFLKAHNMLEDHTPDEFYMNRIPEMTGKETDSARRKRKERLRKDTVKSLPESDKVTPICDNVQICHTEKSKDKELDIDIELDKKKKDSYDPTLDCNYFLNKDFCDAWDDFLIHRKKLKASNTERGLKTLIEKIKTLSNTSEEAILLINNAICNGWKTVFPDRTFNRNSQTPSKWQGEQNFEY